MSNYISNYERLLGPGEPSGMEVLFQCPFPSCAGNPKKKFSVSSEYGFWKCFRCCFSVPGKVYREGSVGHGGTWREFVELMGDEDNISLWSGGNHSPPTPKQDILTPSKARQLWTGLFDSLVLSDNDKDYMVGRGVNPIEMGCVSSNIDILSILLDVYGQDTVIRGGLAYTDGEEVKPRKCIQPGRILIPYMIKGRIDYFVGYARLPDRKEWQTQSDYESVKSRWCKIASPAGYPTRPYGTVPKDSELIIITEGQIKAAAAANIGIPCVGLHGVGNNHKAIANLCKKENVKRVVILFDTQKDKDTQDIVDCQSDRLARDILKAGISVFRAVLPLYDSIEDGVKIDIDSFLVSRGVEEFIDVLKEAKPYVFGE